MLKIGKTFWIALLSLPLALPAHAETTKKSARETILKYYANINAHNYARAFALWDKDESGKVNVKGQNLAAFKYGFRTTKSVKVTIGNVGEIEGAMGHIYIQVPVHIVAKDYRNHIKIYNGTYDLRALSQTLVAVDWEIFNAKLEPANVPPPPKL